MLPRIKLRVFLIMYPRRKFWNPSVYERLYIKLSSVNMTENRVFRWLIGTYWRRSLGPSITWFLWHRSSLLPWPPFPFQVLLVVFSMSHTALQSLHPAYSSGTSQVRLVFFLSSYHFGLILGLWICLLHHLSQDLCRC